MIVVWNLQRAYPGDFFLVNNNYKEHDKDDDKDRELFSISHLSSVLCLHHGLLHVAHVGSHPEDKNIVSDKIIWAIITTLN